MATAIADPVAVQTTAAGNLFRVGQGLCPIVRVGNGFLTFIAKRQISVPVPEQGTTDLVDAPFGLGDLYSILRDRADLRTTDRSPCLLKVTDGSEVVTVSIEWDHDHRAGYRGWDIDTA